jgi:hypothetical protein
MAVVRPERQSKAPARRVLRCVKFITSEERCGGRFIVWGLRRKGSILLTIILPAKGKEAWKNARGGTVLTAKMFIFTSVVGKMSAINRKMNHLVEKNG